MIESIIEFLDIGKDYTLSIKRVELALKETIRLMKEIDKGIGKWPIE